jgi:hypothetical protein
VAYTIEDTRYIGDNRFEVSGDNFRWFLNHAQYGKFDCVNKPDSAWNKRGDWHIVLEGLLGEAAFGRLIGAEPDVSRGYKHVDFIYQGTKIDVKTTKTSRLMVKCSQNGRRLPFHCHVYSCVKLELLDHEECRAILRIEGYATVETLRTLPDIHGHNIKADWTNKELDFSDLVSLDECIKDEFVVEEFA